MLFLTYNKNSLISTDDFSIYTLGNKVCIKTHCDKNSLILGDYTSHDRAIEVMEMIVTDIEADVCVIKIPRT